MSHNPLSYATRRLKISRELARGQENVSVVVIPEVFPFYLLRERGGTLWEKHLESSRGSARKGLRPCAPGGRCWAELQNSRSLHCSLSEYRAMRLFLGELNTGGPVTIEMGACFSPGSSRWLKPPWWPGSQGQSTLPTAVRCSRMWMFENGCYGELLDSSHLLAIQ